MRRFILIPVFFFTLVFSANATHLMGGEITAIDLGNGEHLITLITYRDTVGIPMQTTATFEFIGPSNTSFTTTTPYDSVISGNLLPMYPYGVEVYFFFDTVTFPTPGQWVISWVDCCRNGAIQNLSNPLNESMYLTTSLHVDSTSANSSAFFLVPASIYLPLGTTWQYNPLPFDPDGDSLYWSIDAPLDDLNQYCVGYSAPPSDPNNIFRIDSATGTISWTANQIGNFVATVLVDQFRNGTWIGEIRRDMQFIVVNPSQGFPYWLGTDTLPTDSNGNIALSVHAGTELRFQMIASHTDTSRKIYMDAFSSLFIDPNSNATFTVTEGGGNPLIGTLVWTPDSSYIQDNPYLVVLRATDNYFADDKTLSINVRKNNVGMTEYVNSDHLNVYPNPASNELFVDFSTGKDQKINLSLFDLSGKTALEYSNLEAIRGTNIFGIDTKSLEPGMYILKMENKNRQVLQHKVIIR